MSKFEYNEYGVCLNPEQEIIFENKKFSAKIFLAEKGGQWAYGYDFGIKGGFRSSGLPGFNKHRKPFQRKECARIDAIKFGIECFSDKKNDFNVQPVIDALNKAITPQLSLF